MTVHVKLCWWNELFFFEAREREGNIFFWTHTHSLTPNMNAWFFLVVFVLVYPRVQHSKDFWYRRHTLNSTWLWVCSSLSLSEGEWRFLCFTLRERERAHGCWRWWWDYASPLRSAGRESTWLKLSRCCCSARSRERFFDKGRLRLAWVAFPL